MKKMFKLLSLGLLSLTLVGCSNKDNPTEPEVKKTNEEKIANQLKGEINLKGNIYHTTLKDEADPDSEDYTRVTDKQVQFRNDSFYSTDYVAYIEQIVFKDEKDGKAFSYENFAFSDLETEKKYLQKDNGSGNKVDVKFDENYTNPFKDITKEDVIKQDDGSYTFNLEKYKLDDLGFALTRGKIKFNSIVAHIDDKDQITISIISDKTLDENQDYYKIRVEYTLSPLFNVEKPKDKYQLTQDHKTLRTAMDELKNAKSYTATHNDQVIHYNPIYLYNEETKQYDMTTKLGYTLKDDSYEKSTYKVTSDAILREYDSTNKTKFTDYGFKKIAGKDDNGDDTTLIKEYLKRNNKICYLTSINDDYDEGIDTLWNSLKPSHELDEADDTFDPVVYFENKGNGLFETTGSFYNGGFTSESFASYFANLFSSEKDPEEENWYTSYSDSISIQLKDGHISEVKYHYYYVDGEVEKNVDIKYSNINTTTIDSTIFENVDWNNRNIRDLFSGSYRDSESNKVLEYSKDGSLAFDGCPLKYREEVDNDSDSDAVTNSDTPTTHIADESFAFDEWDSLEGLFYLTKDGKDYEVKISCSSYNLESNPQTLTFEFTKYSVDDDYNYTYDMPEGYTEYSFDLVLQ